MPKIKKQKPDANTHPGITSEAYVIQLPLIGLKVLRYNEDTNRGYQRDLSETWVEDLLDMWSDQLCGVLEVVRRPDGTYVIVDGGHRAECMTRRGYTHAPCRVRNTNGSPETEAWLFEKLNKGRKSMSPFSLLMSARKYKEPLAMGILEAVKKAGYRVTAKRLRKDDQETVGVINCVSKMCALAKNNMVLFERALLAAAQVTKKHKIDHRLLNGLFHTERHLIQLYETGVHKQESIIDEANIARLAKAGEAAFFEGLVFWTRSKGGNDVSKPQINSLVEMLNNTQPKRRKNIIPILQ
jgi:hypothetical protein